MKLESAREHVFVSLDTLRGMVGKDAGASDWLEVTQAQVDAFADLCGDHQFIHVDPARAAETAFGGTIAHGFYTVSLLTYFAQGVRPRVEGTRHSVNYGFDRLRFAAPVKVGARIRGRFRLTRLEEQKPGEITQHWEATVEIEGSDRPALAAEWLVRAYLEGN